jgi:hypothetical protein
MPAEQGFRTRREIESGGRGRRRAPSSLPGKSLFLTGLVVLLLMSAGMLALRSLAVSIQNGGGDEVTQTPAAAPVSVKPTENPDPFAGTMAAEYPEGAAGIVLPPAKQVGPWTPAQVTDIMAKTKQTLVAARLDPQIVEQGNAAGYLATISEGARATVSRNLQTGEALGYVTQLSTEYTLIQQPRVKGSMTVSLGPKKELVVGADYVWIYPLDGPVGDDAPRGPGSKLVVVHTIESYQWFASKSVAPKDTGLRPGAGKLYTVNMDCDLAKSGKLGLQRAAPGNPQNVPDAKAYDPATRPEELPQTC